MTLPSNYYRRGCSAGGGTTDHNIANLDQFGYGGKTAHGIWDLNREQYANFHDIGEGTSYLAQFYQSNSFSSLVTGLNFLYTSGTATVWGTPTNTNNFESLAQDAVGTNSVTNAGKYNPDAFDNANGNHSIVPSAIPGCTQGCLWYAMSYWRNSGVQFKDYMGTVFLNFRTKPATGSNGLKEIFYPNTSDPIEAFVRHGNGSDFPHKSSNLYNDIYTGTGFSYGQSPTSNGYYNSSKFSLDDGTWGFRQGVHVDGKNGFPLDASEPGHSYGVQNYKSSDSSASTLHWGDTEYLNQSYKILLWTEFG